MRRAGEASSQAGAPLPPVDHLVWGGRSLEQEIDRFEEWTGIRAAPGGRHPGEGTHNALIRIGKAMYLELIAPDPFQPAPPHPRWLDLDSLVVPHLLTWAAKSDRLDLQAATARAAGLDLGEVRDGRRELSDGRVLSWRLTYPDLRQGAGLVPFLIDWGASAHPAQTTPGGVELVALRAEHPAPESISGALRHLGIELQVDAGATPTLIAVLDTPRGRIELR